MEQPLDPSVPTVLASDIAAMIGFAYLALLGIRTIRRSGGELTGLGTSMLLAAISGYVAFIGLDVNLPITVGAGTDEGPHSVHIPLLRTLAELAFASVAGSLIARTIDINRRKSGKERLVKLQRAAIWLGTLLLGAALVYQVHFAAHLSLQTAFLSIGGASVFIIGLGLQATLGNVFAGYNLQVSRIIRKGDIVQLGRNGTVGTVWDTTLSTTRIVTRDGEMLVLPNSAVLQKDLMNLDQPVPRLRQSIRIGISYDAPPALVKDVALQVLAADPDVLDDPAPKVWVADFADSAMIYDLCFWIRSYRERDDALDRVRTRLWYALKEARIEIPFPQRSVRMVSAEDVRRQEDATVLRMKDAEERLRACELFDDGTVTAAVRRELARAATEYSFASGEPVVRLGEESDAMFVVATGTCDVVLPNGQRVTLARGSHFGEIALLTGEPRTADVVAGADGTTVLRLPRASVSPILLAQPRFRDRFSAIANERRDALELPGSGEGEHQRHPGPIRFLFQLLRPF
jgi:small-conductance mechanosensitive channel